MFLLFTADIHVSPSRFFLTLYSENLCEIAIMRAFKDWMTTDGIKAPSI
jgi:hypothetical protein